jgi:hypothetical protein
MSDNLALYNAVRVVPPEAQKEIGGGRLKGMTDINPMWRIKALTENFGPCGEGWKYVIKDKQFVTGGKDETAVFVEIDLYYRQGEGWSEPIPGTGGSMFVENQQRGPYVNDECVKMALTDAIGVACKALGVAADIYWGQDKTKYNGDRHGNSVVYDEDETVEISPEDVPDSFNRAKELFDGKQTEKPPAFISDAQQKRLFALAGYKENKELAKENVQKLLNEYGLAGTGEIKKGKEYDEICEKAELMLADSIVSE